ncbi:DUF2225 domain-containing protein [Oceanirhabdus sp. W0125-5]|uniref:DUF2225 domain-containing protein n=1 Tax=Oceanirhabdus sp. W0125-5 TaxID=2999116 RepID=UPI0022F30EE1|nr:DUF2225 domain-containing protein [Oceanirhabdus sp. W0125-5]WBW98771.1 DUF2225 domain-containing protein [Oceanirhabdus sp. W0125-5]
MDNKLFEELKEIGFKNIDAIDIYKKELKDEPVIEKKINMETYLYDRTVVCPVCGDSFKTPSVKSSAYKTSGKESDFYINYTLINPYFYDVWLCNACGYAAMKSDFDRLSQSERKTILENITSQWTGRKYPRVRDENHAIERYKISLLNYIVRKSKNSTKAITCLKIAWMYRLKPEEKFRPLEIKFMEEALTGFKEAYYNEVFPIYGMDKYTTMYLIGELYHRINDYDNALIWLSNVLTTPGVKSSLKDLARDQKDIITIKKKQKELAENNDTETHDPLVQDLSEKTDSSNKKGLFGKLFGKK